MKTKGKLNMKLVAACSVTIFSLMAVFSGAYSWFQVIMKRQASTNSFAVVNIGSCDLYSMDLYKFNYAVHQYGNSTVVDYFTPASGSVNKYTFDKERNQFGYTEGGHWHHVSMMNTYDPVDLAMLGADLKDLNCNSIYKFVITSSDLEDVTFDGAVAKILDRVKQDDELFLSSCTDFDLFYESDLSDSNPLFTENDDHKLYYPDYISKSETLTAEEDVYYKISYLASLKNTHTHFYGESGTDASLASGDSITFTYNSTLDTNSITLYVNVNYAPSQLMDTMYRIYQSNIRCVCDFGFRFFFTPEEDD